MSETMDPLATEMDQQELAQQLLAQSRERGIELVGPGGLSVGRAGCCPLLSWMFGKEDPAAMMFVDFQHEGCPVVRGWSGSGGLLFISERNRARDKTASARTGV